MRDIGVSQEMGRSHAMQSSGGESHGGKPRPASSVGRVTKLMKKFGNLTLGNGDIVFFGIDVCEFAYDDLQNSCAIGDLLFFEANQGLEGKSCDWAASRVRA